MIPPGTRVKTPSKGQTIGTVQEGQCLWASCWHLDCTTVVWDSKHGGFDKSNWPAEELVVIDEEESNGR